MLKSATKKCFSVDCVRDIAPALREAFRVSQIQRPGPVFVELPVDILYPYDIVAEQINSMSRNQKTQSDHTGKNVPTVSLKTKLIRAYSNYRLNHIFADAWKEREYDPLPVHVQHPKTAQVDAVSQMLRRAQRPLCIIGSQAMSGPRGAESLAEDVKRLGLPVYLNGSARGLLGADYPLQFRHSRKEAVREADCVLLLGAICDFRLGYGKIFKQPTKVIAINRCAKAAGLNAGIFWRPNMLVESDVATFVSNLTSRLLGDDATTRSQTATSRLNVDQRWIEKLHERDYEKDRAILSMADEKTAEYINPLRLLLKLRETYRDDDTVIVADGGDFVASASYIMIPDGPKRWLDPGPFGTLGCGAGFALAAKLTYPEKQVVAIMGDGAFGYAISELDTLVRHNIPVHWIIGNDACWTQIAREQVPMLGSSIGCELAYTDYDKVAEGFGALGIKITTDDDVDQRKALERARLKSIKLKKPVVVNALIGKTTFREGSISI